MKKNQEVSYFTQYDAESVRYGGRLSAGNPADVRIAQYESGARTPKRNLLCRMARVLGVSPSALAVPRIKNSEELYCLLRALEDECGIKLSPQSDTAAAIYESHRERSKEQ